MAQGFERLSGALQYQIVNTLGFRGLRPVQEHTIDAVLDGDDCVVLAPTAGGKTEAAFFPLLSRLETEDWRPVSVLYVSPIRALLNNQEDRVSRLAALIGRRATKWHGDVGDGERKRFLADPADILLTTPESLEAMLMSPRVPAREVFAGLRAVVIDEVHAFADDDRGAHLAAVLERLSRYAGRELQRIGLSATVGNPPEILSWLRGSSERAGRVVDPGGARATPVIDIDFVGGMENAATVVHALHPGKKRLVFVDSRRGAEELGRHLDSRGVLTFVSHGSLSAPMRRDAERAFAEGENCVIVATSAMELGIDVGDLDHVLQIDAPGSVASFRQRMGRTGRREGATTNCTFLCTKEQSLLQAAALVRLYDEGFVEPVKPSTRASHILAHQLMSLAVQLGGVGRADAWAWLEGAAPFTSLGDDEREAVLEWMLRKDILRDDEGRLWLGEEGERRYGRANFRALYAVFEAPRLITVRHANQEIGTVDATFLASLQEREGFGSFVLGGRTWQVLEVDWARGRCAVKPATAGRAARWAGSGQHLAYELCQTMRTLLLSDEQDPRWSSRAVTVMKQVRAEHEFLHDADDGLVNVNKSEIAWHNFAGGAANVLLARVLERELGGRVVSRNTSLSFMDDAAKSVVAVKDALRKLGEEGRPNRHDALRFAPDATQTRLSKFMPCLPDDLARELLVERVVDVVNARRVLGLAPEALEEREAPQATPLRNAVEWVTTPKALELAADEWLKEPFLTLDVETTLDAQRLCLAQVGAATKSYLIDPFQVLDLTALARVLESEVVPKVIHNAQFERSVLGSLGMVINNVVDTLEESRRLRGQLAGGHSLMAVARRELDVVLDKRWQTSDWSQRPLTQAQEAYAAMDVEVLVRLSEALGLFAPAAIAAREKAAAVASPTDGSPGALVAERLTPGVLERLLPLAKARLGARPADLVYVGIADAAGYYWCAYQSHFKLRELEPAIFRSYLHDRLLYSLKLGRIDKLPIVDADLLAVGDDLTTEDRERLLAELGSAGKNEPRKFGAMRGHDERGEFAMLNPEAPDAVRRALGEILRLQGVRVLEPDENPSFRGRMLHAANDRGPQLRWHMPVGRYVFVGVADGISEDEVYEYKTTKTDFMAKFVLPRARAQADLYGILYGRARRRVEVLVTETGEAIVEVDAVDGLMAERLAEAIAALERGEAAKLPVAWKCSRCDFRDRCEHSQG